LLARQHGEKFTFSGEPRSAFGCVGLSPLGPGRGRKSVAVGFRSRALPIATLSHS